MINVCGRKWRNETKVGTHELDRFSNGRKHGVQQTPNKRVLEIVGGLGKRYQETPSWKSWLSCHEAHCNDGNKEQFSAETRHLPKEIVWVLGYGSGGCHGVEVDENLKGKNARHKVCGVQ